MLSRAAPFNRSESAIKYCPLQLESMFDSVQYVLNKLCDWHIFFLSEVVMFIPFYSTAKHFAIDVTMACFYIYNIFYSYDSVDFFLFHGPRRVDSFLIIGGSKKAS